MMILITGGSGSGKSEFAEKCIEKLTLEDEYRIYIATMIPYGSEGKERVRKHKKQREKRNFITIEKYYDIHELDFSNYKRCTVLLECMSNLTANMIFEKNYSDDDTVKYIVNGIKKLNEQSENLVIVTNEVFSDGIIYDKETENYLKILGKINCIIASMADNVYEVVCGVPKVFKGKLI